MSIHEVQKLGSRRDVNYDFYGIRRLGETSDNIDYLCADAGCVDDAAAAIARRIAKLPQVFGSLDVIPVGAYQCGGKYFAQPTREQVILIEQLRELSHERLTPAYLTKREVQKRRDPGRFGPDKPLLIVGFSETTNAIEQMLRSIPRGTRISAIAVGILKINPFWSRPVEVYANRIW